MRHCPTHWSARATGCSHRQQRSAARQILQRAILQGESTLRTLLSGSLDQKACYCETGASGRMAGVVSVINRQV